MGSHEVPLRLVMIGLALAVAVVVGIGVAIHWGIMATFRRWRWPREHERRAKLPRVVAQVVKRVRVTRTHRQYVVRVVPPGHVYRSAAAPILLRATIDLPPKARKQVRETGALPIVFDPARPEELILDRAALPDLVDERAEYIKRGILRWTRLEGHN
jgi:hypothetical protein